MGAIFKNSGILDMISNIVSPVNQQPTLSHRYINMYIYIHI